MTNPTTHSADAIAVEVTVDDWHLAIGDGQTPQSLAIEAAQATLALAGPSTPVEIGVRLTDDSEIRVLNREYRGHDRATNVLSFGLADSAEARVPGLRGPQGVPELLGDVVAAYETCAKEAEEQGKSIADHVRHMVVHGVLHLLGYDHENEADAARMEKLERQILEQMGVPDPYDRAAA